MLVQDPVDVAGHGSDVEDLPVNGHEQGTAVEHLLGVLLLDVGHDPGVAMPGGVRRDQVGAAQVLVREA